MKASDYLGMTEEEIKICEYVNGLPADERLEWIVRYLKSIPKEEVERAFDVVEVLNALTNMGIIEPPTGERP